MHALRKFHQRLQHSISRSLPLSLAANYAFRRLSLAQPHDADFLLLAPLLENFPGQILDVGANYGQSSRYFLRRFEEREVFAFEPNPAEVAHLSRIHDPRFRFYNVALGHEIGAAQFFVPKVFGVALTTAGGFDKSSVIHDFTRRPSIWRNHLVFEEIRVRCTTIDSMSFAPGFIKIDVEGHEQQVFLGAIQTIRAFRPLLLVEFTQNQEALLELSGREGYKTFVPAMNGLTPIAKSGSWMKIRNVYMVPEEIELTGLLDEWTDSSA